MVDAVQASLDRIALTDAEVRAWAHLDGDSALVQAAEIDRRREAGIDTGTLTGHVFGVKDNIDVLGMPTVAGFAPYADRIAREDAVVVAAAKREGAVVLGKTHMTQYAAVTEPCATRNPWNLERTPGGTSSGSAAAVAAGQVRVALGTQTGGSILRPSSYTGVVGFKPTYAVVPSVGVLPTAWTLDHVGMIGRTVGDVRDWMDIFVPGGAGDRPHPLRLGVVAQQFDLVDQDVSAVQTAALDRLERSETRLVPVKQPWDMDEVRSVWRTIYSYEIATFHRGIHARYPDDYSAQLAAYVDEGSAHTRTEYLRALERRVELGAVFARTVGQAGVSALVLPTTSDQAPPRATTGSSYFLSPWSLLGVPSVSLPLRPALRMDEFAGEMPVGIQLVSPKHWDRRLLRVAESVEALVQESGSPVNPPRRGLARDDRRR